MAKYKSRPQVRRELSDEAKLAKLRQWEKEYKLNSDDIKKLIEKFGPYAYDVVRLARAEPKNVLERIGYKGFLRSNATIHYFAETDIDIATLAKAIKKNEMQVEAGLKQYNVDAQRTLDNADIIATQNDADKRKKKFDKQVDEHEAEKKEKGQEQEQEQTQVAEQAAEQETPTAGDTSISDMTLDDYVKCYKPEEGPLTGKALQDAAYQDFGRGEGVSPRIHVEQSNNGSPTIGKGNIIFPYQLLDPKLSAREKAKHGSLAGYRQRFQQMDLTKSVGGKQVKLSTEEKGKIFDALVTAVKNKTLKTKNINGYNVILSPAIAANVNMSPAAMRKQFDKDYAYQLSRAYEGLGNGNKAKGKEIFEKYPRKLQFALLHAYYGGYAGSQITKAIQTGKLNPENPVDVLSQLAIVRIVADNDVLEILRKLNPEVFTDAKVAELKRKYKAGRTKANSPRAPLSDAREMGAAGDTLVTAQKRHAQMQAEQQRRNTRVAMNQSDAQRT